MAATFQCPESLVGCECTPLGVPVRNFSAEAPDVPVFLSNVNGGPPVPLDQYFRDPTCLGICESTISQADADLCALRAAQECAWDGWPDPGVPSGRGNARGRFPNDEQTCEITCGEQSSSVTVPFGTVLALTQAEANAKAYALACKRAFESCRINILSPTELPVACVGAAYSYQLQATGGDPFVVHVPTVIGNPVGFCIQATAQPGDPPFYDWEPLQSFPIGGGLSMVCKDGIIMGTPLLPGIYPTFFISVSDSKGRKTTKKFTLRIVEITNGTLIPATDPPVYQLPDAGQGLPYSVTLNANATLGTKTWSVVEGTLPDGLTLDPVSGEISGTPTALEEAQFTIRLTDNP